jgi:hypothetical protein
VRELVTTTEEGDSVTRSGEPDNAGQSYVHKETPLCEDYVYHTRKGCQTPDDGYHRGKLPPKRREAASHAQESLTTQVMVRVKTLFRVKGWAD